jgi:hypothetical protein
MGGCIRFPPVTAGAPGLCWLFLSDAPAQIHFGEGDEAFATIRRNTGKNFFQVALSRIMFRKVEEMKSDLAVGHFAGIGSLLDH